MQYTWLEPSSVYLISLIMLLYQSDHIKWLPHKWSKSTHQFAVFQPFPICPTNEIKLNIIPVCYIPTYIPGMFSIRYSHRLGMLKYGRTFHFNEKYVRVKQVNEQ
jgi:hypothetical protein